MHKLSAEKVLETFLALGNFRVKQFGKLFSLNKMKSEGAKTN